MLTLIEPDATSRRSVDAIEVWGLVEGEPNLDRSVTPTSWAAFTHVEGEGVNIAYEGDDPAQIERLAFRLADVYGGVDVNDYT